MHSRRGSRLRGAAFAALLACVWAISVVAPAGTTAHVVPGYGVSIQAVFDVAGNPLLVANFVPDGSLATPAFSVCRPGRACESLPTQENGLRPGPEPAGTRFTAHARYRGHTYAASVTWLGHVHATTSPGLLGRARHGDVVRPTAAQWQGGWAGGFDQLGVEACRTRGGERCRMLGGGELGCPDGSSSPTIGDWFAGWYLFALDARRSRDDACAGTGYASNASLPVWPLGPTVARSAALGRIIARRPMLRILRPAVLRHGRLYVARLHCPTRCRVSYEVFDSHSGIRSGQARFDGTRGLGINPRGLRRGPLTIHMYIDDSPDLAATTRY